MTSAPIFTEDECRCVLETATPMNEGFVDDAMGGKRP
jgi:hypothetical protein